MSQSAFVPGLLVVAGHVSDNGLDCLKIINVVFQPTVFIIFRLLLVQFVIPLSLVTSRTRHL